MAITENNDYLILKWGTIKGWQLKNSPEAFQALQEYSKLGMNASAAMQKDTDKQKELICRMIDTVNGPIENDWTGKTYESKEAAKKYVLQYGTDTNTPA